MSGSRRVSDTRPSRQHDDQQRQKWAEHSGTRAETTGRKEASDPARPTPSDDLFAGYAECLTTWHLETPLFNFAPPLADLYVLITQEIIEVLLHLGTHAHQNWKSVQKPSAAELDLQMICITPLSSSISLNWVIRASSGTTARSLAALSSASIAASFSESASFTSSFLRASLVRRLLDVLVDVGSANQLLGPFLPGRGMCMGTLKGGTMTGGKEGMFEVGWPTL
ncbi:hypothetical protein EYF80_023358 [Liparis tanakae]|uniref:Uncharacterized protein n=1 Tax=Liparis tanakae TaxID=230148 RepID=A0A4Z2HLL5_9TELE|nr:hypothetical protein EYF80_023358 [Liparis tanakae]